MKLSELVEAVQAKIEEIGDTEITVNQSGVSGLHLQPNEVDDTHELSFDI